MADLQGRFCDFHVSTGVPVVEERGPGPQARLERALFTNFANVESNLSGGALRILIASGAQVEKIRAMGKPVLFGAIDDGYTVLASLLLRAAENRPELLHKVLVKRLRMTGIF
jgi:hypothetical protein